MAYPIAEISILNAKQYKAYDIKPCGCDFWIFSITTKNGEDYAYYIDEDGEIRIKSIYEESGVRPLLRFDQPISSEIRKVILDGVTYTRLSPYLYFCDKVIMTSKYNSLKSTKSIDVHNRVTTNPKERAFHNTFALTTLNHRIQSWFASTDKTVEPYEEE